MSSEDYETSASLMMTSGRGLDTKKPHRYCSSFEEDFFSARKIFDKTEEGRTMYTGTFFKLKLLLLLVMRTAKVIGKERKGREREREV